MADGNMRAMLGTGNAMGAVAMVRVACGVRARVCRTRRPREERCGRGSLHRATVEKFFSPTVAYAGEDHAKIGR